jgi:peptidoglycan/xylan/chitin deacetylase (PgdA/CDA1 family)
VRKRNRLRSFGPAILVFFAFGLVVGALLFGGPLKVSLNGRSYRIPRKSTVAQLLTLAHTHVRPGSLLDVDGIPIQSAATLGKIVVDGRLRQPTFVLQGGDHVRVINGADTTESLTKLVRHVGREVADPQLRLESVPGTEIITIGTTSRKIVDVHFDAGKGPAKAEKSVALTFDDGPSPLTAQILDVLAKYKVPATFFLVGIQVKQYPKLVRREIKADMVVANHSWSHPTRPVFAHLTKTRAKEEVERVQKAIVDLGGKTDLFRPPGGSWSDKTTKLVKKMGLRTVLWSVDPNDWRKGRSSGAIVSNVLSHVGPGSIVLLHDGGNNVASTLSALPAIIKGIRAKGLHLVVLG